MIIQESSINRIMHFINGFDIVCITAFRGKFPYDSDYTLDQNLEALVDEIYNTPASER